MCVHVLRMCVREKYPRQDNQQEPVQQKVRNLFWYKIIVVFPCCCAFVAIL